MYFSEAMLVETLFGFAGKECYEKYCDFVMFDKHNTG